MQGPNVDSLSSSPVEVSGSRSGARSGRRSLPPIDTDEHDGDSFCPDPLDEDELATALNRSGGGGESMTATEETREMAASHGAGGKRPSSSHSTSEPLAKKPAGSDPAVKTATLATGKQAGVAATQQALLSNLSDMQDRQQERQQKFAVRNR